MLIGRQQPLEIAAKVLKSSTIEGVTRSPSFHLQGWKILDRWAFNNPTELRALEAKGEMFLLERLLKQQQVEHDILTQSTTQMQQGMAELEILQMHEIQTEL